MPNLNISISEELRTAIRRKCLELGLQVKDWVPGVLQEATNGKMRGRRDGVESAQVQKRDVQEVWDKSGAGVKGTGEPKGQTEDGEAQDLVEGANEQTQQRSEEYGIATDVPLPEKELPEPLGADSGHIESPIGVDDIPKRTAKAAGMRGHDPKTCRLYGCGMCQFAGVEDKQRGLG